jgi:hypothetical protein
MPSCEPLWPAAVACGESRQRRERAAATGGSGRKGCRGKSGFVFPIRPQAQGRRLRPRSADWCKRLGLAVAMGLQWHTGSRGAHWGDADAGRPGLPSHSPCAGRCQAEQETAAAWALPMAAVGDGSVTHETWSGGGPGAGFLADTGWCHGRWVCRKFQMLEPGPGSSRVLARLEVVPGGAG